MFIDVHAHYDDEKFTKDIHEVLTGLKEKNINTVINAGTNAVSSQKSIDLAKKYDFLYGCCGIHPHDSHSYKDDLPVIEKLLTNEKCVAIGETGLDYYYENTPRDIQQESFRAHMELAVKYKLPIVIHNRDSTRDCIDIIKEYKQLSVQGLFHCFSGGPETAKTVLDIGYYISIGGPVTFKNARKTIETVKYVPLDRLLTETDCPYLSPEPKRGTRNDSGNIPLIVKKIAEIKCLSEDTVINTVLLNARNLFNKINIK